MSIGRLRVFGSVFGMPITSRNADHEAHLVGVFALFLSFTVCLTATSDRLTVSLWPFRPVAFASLLKHTAGQLLVGGDAVEPQHGFGCASESFDCNLQHFTEVCVRSVQRKQIVALISCI